MHDASVQTTTNNIDANNFTIKVSGNRGVDIRSNVG
jgi:hypothetical protein